MKRIVSLVCLLLISTGVQATALIAATDTLVDALATTDTFLSPALQTADPVAARLALSEAARAARSAGDPVKIAVVPGPAGAPSMLSYARALRRDLNFRGRVVVAAPDRPVVVAGPQSPAETTRALRRGKVGQVQDVVERAVAAANATQTAARKSNRGSGARGLFGLFGLALIGGVWAVAIGMRRRQGVDRQRFHTTRVAVSDGLDELASCIERAGPTGEVSSQQNAIDRAAREYAAAREDFGRARDVSALVETGGRVRGALRAMEEAGIPPSTEVTVGLDRTLQLPPIP